MSSIRLKPDHSDEHSLSPRDQSRISNRAGITMVRAAAGRRRRVARAAVLDKRFSHMAVSCGA